MANPMFDAITASITQQFDPQQKSVSEFLSAVTAEKRQDVVDRRAKTVENLERKISKLEESDKPNQDVLLAYTALLKQAQDH